MLLKTFAQLFKRPKSKASAWDAAGSGKRLTYWQPENTALSHLWIESNIGSVAFVCQRDWELI